MMWGVCNFSGGFVSPDFAAEKLVVFAQVPKCDPVDQVQVRPVIINTPHTTSGKQHLAFTTAPKTRGCFF